MQITDITQVVMSLCLCLTQYLPQRCGCFQTCQQQCSLQLTSHTLSIGFRHLPPYSARFSYTTEGALFISVQLSSDAVSALQKVWVLITLRAPLSGTFLHTLPDLVTLLKGHSLSPRICPATWSAPSERFGY